MWSIGFSSRLPSFISWFAFHPIRIWLEGWWGAGAPGGVFMSPSEKQLLKPSTFPRMKQINHLVPWLLMDRLFMNGRYEEKIKDAVKWLVSMVTFLVIICHISRGNMPHQWQISHKYLAPSLSPNSFIFMQFSAKNWPTNRLANHQMWISGNV